MLCQDVDLVWRLDPRPFFPAARRQDVDTYWMYDGGSFYQQPLYANGGFFVVRSNERTRRLLYEISAASEGERSQQAIALHAAPTWCSYADAPSTRQAVLAPLVLHYYFMHGLQISILGPRCSPRYSPRYARRSICGR